MLAYIGIGSGCVILYQVEVCPIFCPMILVHALEWHARHCNSARSFTAACDCDVPERWLAECEAKRRIVELAAAWEWAADHPPNVETGRGLLGTARQLRSVLASLALPHADHPDYRPEWRP